MSNKLITLSNHTNVMEAYYVLNRLKEIDVIATVADENVIGVNFLLGNAVQWIKVQVLEKDADRAVAYLESITTEKVPEEDIPWDEFEPEEGAKPEEEQALAALPPEENIVQPNAADEPAENPDERLARASFRLALYGMVLLPFTLISLYVVVRLAFRGVSLSPSGTRKFYIAVLINFFNFFSMIFVWYHLLIAPLLK